MQHLVATKQFDTTGGIPWGLIEGVLMLELQPSKARYFSSVVEMRSQAKCQRFHNCTDIQCNTAPLRMVLPYSLDKIIKIK